MTNSKLPFAYLFFYNYFSTTYNGCGTQIVNIEYEIKTSTQWDEANELAKEIIINRLESKYSNIQVGITNYKKLINE